MRPDVTSELLLENADPAASVTVVPPRLCVALFAAIAALTGPNAATACSVTETFVPSTNVELVASAETIVVARAAAGTGGGVSFEVKSVIKGKGLAAGDTFELEGTTAYSGRSTQNDFSKARPGAYAGGCIAYDYKVGGQFLLFLASFKGAWRVAGEPFARVNEEVDPKGDAWLTAVREYAKIAALPAPADRIKALHVLHDRFNARNATPAEHAIAADLDAHFAAATPNKSFAELEPLFDASPSDSRILMAIGVGGDPAARKFMGQLVDRVVATTKVDGEVITAIAAYYAKVADPAAMAKLASLYVALGPKHQDERWPVMWLLIRHADGSLLPVMEQALAGANEEEAGRLGAYFARHPSETARNELRRRTGTAYESKTDLTFGLAGAGDPGVIKWAEAKLTGPRDDNSWVAVYAIARSPLPGADAIARRIIIAGGADLVALTQAYSEAVHPQVDARLADIEHGKPTAEVVKWLERARYERAHPQD